MVGGRNDQEIADALKAIAYVMAQENIALQVNQNQHGIVDEFHGLGKFQRNNPPTWVQEIEKIFRVIPCIDAHKVLFGTIMMSEEAEYMWENARKKLEVTTKFEELSRFYPFYNYVEVEGSKISDEDSHARSAHYKSVTEKKSRNQNRGKLDVTPNDKGKLSYQEKATSEKETSDVGTPTSLKFFKYREIGHHVAK
ncbi:uncharacterized protein LOC127113120 [Lathyrus oleraceus]|uniref:uncharacterized protein LOC127113120 n=1 Tax=Pisum sativum TaxID=3888 RepID=UPI0021D1B37F|nr:uncharacterized protein LOC127113120 [Pisum sativum]